MGLVFLIVGDQPTKVADLGVALLSSAVIAAIVLWFDDRIKKRESEAEVARRLERQQFEDRLRTRDAESSRERHEELKKLLLQQLVVSGQSLEGLRLPNENLSGLFARDKVLSDCDFSYADLHDSDLTGSQLHRSRFRSADLSNASLRDVRAHGADFSYAVLDGANLAGARLVDANFTGASLEGVDLELAELDGPIGLSR